MYGVFHRGASRITGNSSHGFSRGSLRPSLTGAGQIDPDAAAWIAAVEAADGEALEPGILEATSTLFRGLKNSESRVAGRSNWEAMDSLGILGVSRTIDGGLVPVIGPEIENQRPFVTGDIVRGLGWQGSAAGAGKNLRLVGYARGESLDDLGFGYYMTTFGTTGFPLGVGTGNFGAMSASRATMRMANINSLRIVGPESGDTTLPVPPCYVGFSRIGDQVHSSATGPDGAEDRIRTQAIDTSLSAGIEDMDYRPFCVVDVSGPTGRLHFDGTIGMWHVGKAHDPFAVRPLFEAYFSTIHSILT